MIRWVLLWSLFISSICHANCDETPLLPPSVRLLEKAYREGLVSTASVRAWLDGHSYSPVLNRARTTDQIAVLKGLSLYLESKPLDRSREAIEQWLIALGHSLGIQETARLDTQMVIAPQQLMSVSASLENNLATAIRSESDGGVSFAMMVGSAAHIYRWTAAEVAAGANSLKKPDVRQLANPPVRELKAWSISFTPKGELQGFVLEDNVAQFVNFSAPQPTLISLGQSSAHGQSEIYFLGEKLGCLRGPSGNVTISPDPKLSGISLYVCHSIRTRSAWVNAIGETEFIALTEVLEISLFKRNREGYLSATKLADGVAAFQAVKGPSGEVAVAVQKFGTAGGPAPFVILDSAGTQKFPTIYVDDADAAEPLEAVWTPSGRFVVGVRCRSRIRADGSSFRVYEPFVGQDFRDIPLVEKLWKVPRPHWVNGLMDFPLLALMDEDDLKIVEPFQSLTPIAKIGGGLGIYSFSEDGRFFSLFNKKRGTVSFFSIQRRTP